MNRKILLASAAAIVGGMLLAAPAAKADLLQVGLQDSLVNGGNLTVENQLTSTNGFINWSQAVTYGSYATNGGASDTLADGLPNILESNTLDVSSRSLPQGQASYESLTIYVDASGQNLLHGPATSWQNLFENNSLNNATVTVSAYLDLADETLTDGAAVGLPSGAQLLQTETFTGHGVSPVFTNTTDITPATDPSGSYSIIDVYTITATGPNQTIAASITEDATVPTPAPLSLLGFGLVALAFLSRRRGVQN